MKHKENNSNIMIKLFCVFFSHISRGVIKWPDLCIRESGEVIQGWVYRLMSLYMTVYDDTSLTEIKN